MFGIELMNLVGSLVLNLIWVWGIEFELIVFCIEYGIEFGMDFGD